MSGELIIGAIVICVLFQVINVIRKMISDKKKGKETTELHNAVNTLLKSIIDKINVIENFLQKIDLSKNITPTFYEKLSSLQNLGFSKQSQLLLYLFQSNISESFYQQIDKGIDESFDLELMMEKLEKVNLHSKIESDSQVSYKIIYKLMDDFFWNLLEQQKNVVFNPEQINSKKVIELYEIGYTIPSCLREYIIELDSVDFIICIIGYFEIHKNDFTKLTLSQFIEIINLNVT